jgi:hypothetical protein
LALKQVDQKRRITMKQIIMKRFRSLGVISTIVIMAALLPLTAMSADSDEATQTPVAAASAQREAQQRMLLIVAPFN